MTWTYPLAVGVVYKIFTTEEFPTLWQSDNHITISAAAENSIGLTAANIVTYAVANGGSVAPLSASINCFLVGKA